MPIPGNLLTTAMAVMPHTDVDRALETALGLDLPFWPQLPLVSYYEDMYVQASEHFPGIVLDMENRHLGFSMDKFMLEVEETLARFEEPEYFDISPEYSVVYHRFLEMDLSDRPAIRGQLEGPISFGLNVQDQDDRPILFDDTVRPFMLDFMARRVNVQLTNLKRLNANAFMFVDEPGLQFLFSALSGYGDVAAREDLAYFFAQIERPRGVHLCGNPDWDFLLGLDLDVLSLDVYSNGEVFASYSGSIKRFLDRGGVLVWGIVPHQFRALRGGEPGQPRGATDRALGPAGRPGHRPGFFAVPEPAFTGHLLSDQPGPGKDRGKSLWRDPRPVGQTARAIRPGLIPDRSALLGHRQGGPNLSQGRPQRAADVVDVDAFQAVGLDEDRAGGRDRVRQAPADLLGDAADDVLGELGPAVGPQHDLRLVRPFEQVLGYVQRGLEALEQVFIGDRGLGVFEAEPGLGPLGVGDVGEGGFRRPGHGPVVDLGAGAGGHVADGQAEPVVETDRIRAAPGQNLGAELDRVHRAAVADRGLAEERHLARNRNADLFAPLPFEHLSGQGAGVMARVGKTLGVKIADRFLDAGHVDAAHVFGEVGIYFGFKGQPALWQGDPDRLAADAHFGQANPERGVLFRNVLAVGQGAPVVGGRDFGLQASPCLFKHKYHS